MPDRRLSRIADMVRAEINHILREDLRDGRLALASVSEVRLSADARVARVLVSHLANDVATREAAVAALTRAQGLIRHKLAPRLHVRHIPELRFELDRNAEHGARMSEILDSLSRETPVEPAVARESDEPAESGASGEATEHDPHNGGSS